jgi:thioredoxin 1
MTGMKFVHMNIYKYIKIMKKLTYLVSILAVSLFGCSGQTASEKPVKEASVMETVASDNNSPVHLTKEQFLKQVMNYEKNLNTWVFEGEKPCLVDFYADWCAPCRITSPILEDLAKQFAGRINIYKVDVDREQELASVFGVQSIPTFLFCPLEGDPVISSGIAGTPAATKEMFIKQIEEILLKTEAKPTI